MRAVLAAVVTAVALLSSVVVPTATPAAAHCTIQTGRWYAHGYKVFPAGATNGVSAEIEWTQGNVCGGGVSHSVTLLAGNSEFLQVGWRYYYGWSAPKMYCEGRDPYFIKDFALASGVHRYRWRYIPQEDVWSCSLDTNSKYEVSGMSYMGFNSGYRLNGQGEAHVHHAQIGRNAPDKLRFLDMEYRITSSGAWSTLTLLEGGLDAPLGRDVPNSGRFRVWTNAH